jgi:hypothetical protein
MNNIFSHHDMNRNLLSITKMQLDQRGNHTWNYKKGIKNYLEVENYIQEYQTIQSKKTLSKVLGADELSCDMPNVRFRLLQELSSYLSVLICYKYLFFGSLVAEIFGKFRMIS